MEGFLSLISWTCIVGGSLFAFIGGLGLHRLPDFFTRLHAAGITDTLGAGLILFGLMVQGGVSIVTVKLILILGFLLFTSPTATHALAQAALHGQQRPLLGKSPR